VHPVERIALRIIEIRGTRVILDTDLAELYGVETRVLLQAVRRNLERFPQDFMIPLSAQDVARLKSQSVISKPPGRGGRRSLPQAFTEHGTIMAATVLSSPRAIEVSVYVVRAFVRMREAIRVHAELARRLDELERKVGTHDRAVGQILEAIRQLTQPPEPRRRRIGFL
jgi:hypothetical protein